MRLEVGNKTLSMVTKPFSHTVVLAGFFFLSTLYWKYYKISWRYYKSLWFKRIVFETLDIKAHWYCDLHLLIREIIIVKWWAFINNHIMRVVHSFKIRQMLTWGVRDLPGLKGIEKNNGNAAGGLWLDTQGLPEEHWSSCLA